MVNCLGRSLKPNTPFCLIITIATVSCVLSEQLCFGGMLIQGYDALRHDRFNNSVNFVGVDYNWSGVGRTDTKSWGTLVSPNYVVGATHGPTNGAIRFYTSNAPNGVFVERTIVSGQQIAGSDLWLSRLSAPVTPDLGVSSFAVATAPTSNVFLNQTVFTFGITDGVDVNNNAFSAQVDQRMGRNTIDAFIPNFNGVTGDPSTSNVFIYDYDDPGGVGTDEAQVRGGDSGAPTFVIIDGKPALIGIHWFRFGVGDFGSPNTGTGDTYVSSYINDLNAAMTALNGGIQGDTISTLNAVPEPSSLVLLGLAIPAAIPMIRRFQNRAARGAKQPAK